MISSLICSDLECSCNHRKHLLKIKKEEYSRYSEHLQRPRDRRECDEEVKRNDERSVFLWLSLSKEESGAR